MPGPDYLIHVAGLNLWWRATRNGVQECTRNAVLAAAELGVRSMALPLIGAGTGGLTQADSRAAAWQDVLWSLLNVREFIFVR